MRPAWFGLSVVRVRVRVRASVRARVRGGQNEGLVRVRSG